ncbi:unnamed protein product [Arctogadus glacialis]
MRFASPFRWKRDDCSQPLVRRAEPASCRHIGKGSLTSRTERLYVQHSGAIPSCFGESGGSAVLSRALDV